jgi:hypothetical protein
MKSNVTEGDFIHGFRDCNRENNFSYEGRKALYEYLIDYEEDAGEELEYDPIAVCCDYTEYEDIDEYNVAYDTEYEDFDDMQYNCDQYVMRFPIYEAMKCVGEHIIVRDE